MKLEIRVASIMVLYNFEHMVHPRAMVFSRLTRGYDKVINLVDKSYSW